MNVLLSFHTDAKTCQGKKNNNKQTKKELENQRSIPVSSDCCLEKHITLSRSQKSSSSCWKQTCDFKRQKNKIQLIFLNFQSFKLKKKKQSYISLLFTPS